MPDFGAPVAQNVQAPNLPQTLGSLMGLQQQKQAIQSNAQQLQIGANQAQQAQQTQEERQRVTQMMQSGVDDQGNSVRGPDGQPDPAKLLPALGRMAPLTGQKYAQDVMQTQNARVQLQTASTALTGQQRQALMGPIQAITTNPNDPEIIKNSSTALDSWAEAHPEMGGIVSSAKSLLSHLESEPDPAKRSHMANSFSALFQPGQPVQTQPQGATVSNGQQTLVGTTAPPVAGGAFTPTTGVQQQLPPTTPTVGAGGQPGYVGPQGAPGGPASPFNADGVQGPQRAAILKHIAATDPDPSVRAQAQQALNGGGAGAPSSFVPSALPPGQAQNIANNVDEMNRHFAGLQDAASGAQLQQGLIGNIKSLAGGAATGTGAGRKAFVSGLLSALHVPGTGDEAKDTDLLEKNMAQLNLSTPASTDAARTIVSAARPHGTMQAGAITEAADQLGGQIQANVAMRNALQGYKMMGDVQGYQAARTKLESVADPRAWQYVNLGPGTPEAKAFLQKLTPADRSSLIDKTGQLEQMGLLK